MPDWHVEGMLVLAQSTWKGRNSVYDTVVAASLIALVYSCNKEKKNFWVTSFLATPYLASHHKTLNFVKNTHSADNTKSAFLKLEV